MLSVERIAGSQTDSSNLKPKVRNSCRSCESRDLDHVLNLGNLYVSNFADSPDPAAWPRVPLELLLCNGCGLVQLRHTTPSEWMYKHYWYRSGVSATMRAALADITKKAVAFAPLRRGDSVLDIGCNDGTLLRSYSADGIRRVGFEPAENLASEAADAAERIVPDFFSAKPVAGEKFKIITSIAMFYDLEDPNSFASDVASVLAEDGVWIIEMHYLAGMLEANAFDAICHEHLEYYSLLALESVVERAGLRVADVETNDINGGSIRAYVVHRDSPETAIPFRMTRVAALRANEKLARFQESGTYAEFGRRIGQIGDRVNRWLSVQRAKGKVLAAYGASTKGNTLLQVYGLDRSIIRCAAERNPDKWGKYTVGSWIPIVAEQDARDTASVFLVLPWHFLREMQEREKEFIDNGGTLAAPLPTPTAIDRHGIRRIG